MKKILNSVSEYFKETIATKKGMKKRIYELERDLKEARENEKDAIERMNMYKSKFQNEHKKYKELEKESKEIIEEFTNSLKDLEKENRKLKKENK